VDARVRDAGIYNWDFNSSDGYGGMTNENITVTINNVPLSNINLSPPVDPVTTIGNTQTFGVTLNRTADIIWYNNDSEVFRVIGILSANYTNSSAGVGIHNITAFGNDGYDSISNNWTWNVTDGIAGNGGWDGGGGGGEVLTV